MTIPYRTQRALKRLLVVILVIAVIFAAVWGCWLLWVQRYIIYTAEDGAKLNFDLPPMAEGELAVPPEDVDIPIYFNEGEAAVTTNTELTQLNGYYVEPDALSDISAVKSQIQSLKAGTAVMIDGGKFDAATSATAALQAGDIGEEEASGIVIDSDAPLFDGVMINDSTYTINDMFMTADGSGGTDFTGYGAGVVAEVQIIQKDNRPVNQPEHH